MLLSLVALLAWQPDAAMLGQLYEEAFERKKQEYGASDTRTVQAARDLGLFLSKQGAAAGAQKVFTEVVRLDETALGPNAKQTLADVAALANVSRPRQAEPLWRRAAKSPEQKVAARAFAALGQLRETAGDQAGAAPFYRQALAKEEAALSQATTTPEKADLAILLSGVAQVLGQIVDPTEGIAVLRRSLAINRSLLGARHPETATVEANLAGCCWMRMRWTNPCGSLRKRYRFSRRPWGKIIRALRSRRRFSPMACEPRATLPAPNRTTGEPWRSTNGSMDRNIPKR